MGYQYRLMEPSPEEQAEDKPVVGSKQKAWAWTAQTQPAPAVLRAIMNEHSMEVLVRPQSEERAAVVLIPLKEVIAFADWIDQVTRGQEIISGDATGPFDPAFKHAPSA